MITLNKVKHAVCAGTNTMIGLAFLVWSFFIGAGVSRFLLSGQTREPLPEILSSLLGALLVAFLVWLWRRIARQDRAILVKNLWRFLVVFIVLALTAWWRRSLPAWPAA